LRVFTCWIVKGEMPVRPESAIRSEAANLARSPASASEIPERIHHRAKSTNPGRMRFRTDLPAYTAGILKRNNLTIDHPTAQVFILARYHHAVSCRCGRNYVNLPEARAHRLFGKLLKSSKNPSRLPDRKNLVAEDRGILTEKLLTPLTFS